MQEMKKYLLFFCFIVSFSAFSQTKMTADEAEKSNDPKVIAAFIKNNPNDPKSSALRRKLTAMVLGDNYEIPQTTKTSSSNSYSNSNIQKTGSAAKQDEKPDSQKTAALLTAIFSNDPNRKEAYVDFQNNSKCGIVIKITGKQNYSLSVPAKGKNFILVEKGTYTLTTDICGAKYSSTKDITKDFSITLNR
jgi:hypothetical protein